MDKFVTITRATAEATKSSPGPAKSSQTHRVLEFFTDGAASRNGKAGAAGGIGVFFGDGSPLNISEPLPASVTATNNVAELTAAVRGLDAVRLSVLPRLEPRARVSVVMLTDSMYAINCVTKWLPAWERNGWKTKTGAPVANRRLLERLARLRTLLGASFVHVRAHGREPRDKASREHFLWYGNMRADQLATAALPRARARA